MSWLIKIFRYLVLRGFPKYLLSAGLYYLALIKNPQIPCLTRSLIRGASRTLPGAITSVTVSTLNKSRCPVRWHRLC